MGLEEAKREYRKTVELFYIEASEFKEALEKVGNHELERAFTELCFLFDDVQTLHADVEKAMEGDGNDDRRNERKD